MAFACPQYNLNEINEALIKLLWNPDIDFEEIYVAPDFATGAILLNEEEVKESMRNGQGKACKLRSVVEYDAKEKCFVVTEIPYSVYTNTICGELEEILNGEENPGIDRFNDLTGEKPLIKIYLSKNANADKVLRYLYKNTSLQSHFGINLTMLDNGRYPRVFTWKEALQAHINHELKVYRRGFEFDLKKITDRLHIIEALLRAIANIDEVVKTIKSSANTAAASSALQKFLTIDEVQAKAILDIKLARLAHLEVDKLEKEKTELLAEKERIEAILNDEILLKREVEAGLNAVAKKFGDERRTKIMNISKEDEEPTEVKTLQVSLTNKNSIFVTEASSLYTQKRGGVGQKTKLDKGEYIISSSSLMNTETILFFTRDGEFYSHKASSLALNEKIVLESLFSMKSWQKVIAMAATDERKDEKHILFVTKNGMIKKSEFSEYNTNRNMGVKALALDSNDEIVNVLFLKDENIGILTEGGNFIIIKTSDVRPLGRISKGVRGIKLNDGDCVSNAHVIPAAAKEIMSISGAGLCKKTPISEFSIQGKNTKGSKIQKVTGDFAADFMPIVNETDVLVAATNSCIKLSLQEVPSLSRATQGNKAIKLLPNDSVIGLTPF